MNSVFTVCAFLALMLVSCVAADAHLEAALNAHVRALDEGKSEAEALLPFADRQASECVPSVRSVQPTSCGLFTCTFCSSFVCKPVRIENRGGSQFTITCKRALCTKDATGKNCCKRIFTINRTCPPQVLPRVSCVGVSPGDTLAPIETVIRIPSRLSTDVYLLSDTTISMIEEIKAVQDGMVELLSNLQDNESQDIAFGVGQFKDERELGKLKALGGKDFPEAGLAALNEVATSSSIGWREKSRKFIVLTNITVVAVSFQGQLDVAPRTELTCAKNVEGSQSGPNQAKDIAVATGGKVSVVSASKPNALEVRTKILESIGNSSLILKSTTTCGLAINVVRNPTLTELNPVLRGTTIKFNQTISVDPEACSFDLSDCVTRFSVSGPDIATQEIATSEIRCAS
eukprot:IDg16649t1